jgi:Phospholipase D-like domain at C-terminus of MIT
LRKRLENYINRAEFIKKHIEKEKEAQKYHEKIDIENGATGFSYNTVLGRFLDEDVSTVNINDPYIRNVHQVFIIDSYSYFLLIKIEFFRSIIYCDSVNC